MELYVFPLGHVLLYPSSAKPLHIFEPRYIQMIKDAVESKTCVAIGFVDDPSREHKYKAGEHLGFVRNVVGYGRPVIVEEKDDGSMVVFLQGVGKAKLGAVLDRGKPYIVCDAHSISENHDLSIKQFRLFSVMQKVFLRWMQNHIPDAQVRSQFLGQVRTPEEVVGCYASYIVADHDMQQLILESNDINEKVNLINGLIASGELL